MLAGLRYLQACQREGGAWGDDGEHRKYGEVRIGKSGLALLAFLGSGYTHDRPNEFRRTVTRVLAFLLRRQDDRTGHIGDGSSYSHGIATYAIAEAYAMTRDPALRRPLELAVERIVRAQMRGRGPKTGGWGYYYAGRPRHDDGWPRMSASIWQVMALESASLAGVSVPSESLDAARGFVLASWDQELGAVRYNHDAQWRRAGYETLPGSTSGGLFAMQLLGVPREDHRYRGALAFVLARPPAFPWRRHSNDDMVLRVQGNLYFHYHATLALYRHGGKEWQRWNAILKPQLVDNQERDGSWRPISAYADYAGDTRTDRSYTTAMCVLMLEVYYRYLTPLLEGGAASQTAAGSKATPGPADVWIEVLEVRPDSAADRLGMKAGDRILRLAGRTPATLADLDKALGEITVDRPAVLTLDRAGRTVQIVLRRRLTGVRVQVRRGR